MAGKWALETAAFEEGLAHLERAADRVEAAPPGDRADLLFHLGTAQRANGRWDDAIESWKEAVDAYEAIGDTETAGRVCNDAGYSLGWAARFAESLAITQRGIDLLGDRVSATRARLLAQQGFILGYAGVPFEVGDALVGQALAIADELGDPGLLGSCLLGKSLNRLGWMRRTECSEVAMEAAELLRGAGSRWEESVVLGFAGQGLVGAGRFEDARDLVAYLEPLAERLGNVGALLQCGRVLHGMVEYAETGDLPAFEASGRRDLEFARANELPWVSNSHSWLGLASYLKGDWDEARRYLETAAELEPPGNLRGWDRSLLFELHAYAGERDEALAMLDDGLPVAGQPNGWGHWAMLLSAVEGLTVLGERDRAGAYYDLVIECIERTQAICAGFHDSRLVERSAGIAATAARRFDDAELHFNTALQQAVELPHRPEEAHTRHWYAAMLVARDGPGDRARAEELAREAVAAYERMGMPRHRDRAARLLSPSR